MKNFLMKSIVKLGPRRTFSTLLQDQLKLTQICIDTILNKRKSRFQNQFLRLSVEGGEGCQGYKYNFNFDSTLNEDDFVIKENNEIIFAVDIETMKLVQGSVVDYEDKMIRAAFYVQENPNAEKSCSCKVSFSPKNFIL